MTSFQENVQQQLQDAMRKQETVRRDALRMLIAAIHNAEIEAGRPLDEEAALAVVQKQAKQRRESIAEFAKAGRQDLVDREQAELEVLETFLPAQASEDDIRKAAEEIVAETGASSPRDIGKVMPVLMQRFAGRADGRQVNAIVRELLGE